MTQEGVNVLDLESLEAYLRSVPEIDRLADGMLNVFSLLSERDPFPNHSLSEEVDLFRTYRGTNSLKIREMVRTCDQRYSRLLDHYVLILRRMHILHLGLSSMQEEIRTLGKSKNEGSSEKRMACLRLLYEKQMRLPRAEILFHEKTRACQKYKKKMLPQFRELSHAVSVVVSCTSGTFERVKQICKLKDCANCGVDVTDFPKQCSRCKLPYYCSRACQGQHWKQGHKRFCLPKAEQKIEQLPEMDAMAPTCAVCFEHYTSEMKTLKCGHVLHSNCASLVLLFCEAKVCPICRVDFD